MLLCLCALLPPPAQAIITLPASANLWHQTSGRERCANVGDWYTSNPTAGCGGVSPTGNPGLHTFVIEVPDAALTGGSATIQVFDAESNDGAGDLDEENGGAEDPVRFWLENAAGATVGDFIVPSGSPNNTTLDFVVTTAGTYTLRTYTGGFPVSGNATANLNDDDNSWRLVLPDGVRVTFFEGTLQHNDGGNIDVDLYFTVGAGVTGLQLRNFDADNNFGSITYRRPNGAGVAGTESGNATWNGGGNLDTGADVINNLATGAGGADLGVWVIEVRGWSNNNQAIFEVLDQDGNPLPVADDDDVDGVTNSGTWTMTADGQLDTSVGVAVDHPFSVQNQFTANDRVNFVLTGTGANVTTQLRVAGGGVLTDTDSDGNPDTGILAPNASIDLVLRVTPGVGAVSPDVTTVTGTSTLAGALGTTPVDIAVAKTTRFLPNLSTSTKVAVDVNGGLTNPGDTLSFTITLAESGGFAVTGAQLVDVYPATVGSISNIVVPAGATVVPSATQLEVTGIDVPAGGSVQISFDAVVTGTPGQAIDNTANVTATGIALDLSSATIVISSASTPISGDKPLYVNITTSRGNDDPIALQRELPVPTEPDENRVQIDEGANDSWELAPALRSDLVILAGTIDIRLFLTEEGDGNERTIRIDLERGSTGVSFATDTITQALSTTDTNPTPVDFSLPVGAETIADGDTIVMRVTNQSSGSSNRRVRVWTQSLTVLGDPGASLLDSYSRVLVPTSTVINVDSVVAYDDDFAAPSGNPWSVVNPGDVTWLRAVVSDPFGAEDITSARITVTDPGGGATSLTDSPMAVVDAGAGTALKVFETAFTPNPLGVEPFGPTGFWTISVTAQEGRTDEGISHTALGEFELGLPHFVVMKISPSVFSHPISTGNPKRIPGAVVDYRIMVTNQGRGRSDTGTVVVSDTLPARLLLATDSGNGSPLQFLPGSSGLNHAYSASDLLFPPADGGPLDDDNDGCFDNVTGFSITPIGRMNGEAPPAPSFTIVYRACVL